MMLIMLPGLYQVLYRYYCCHSGLYRSPRNNKQRNGKSASDLNHEPGNQDKITRRCCFPAASSNCNNWPFPQFQVESAGKSYVIVNRERERIARIYSGHISASVEWQRFVHFVEKRNAYSVLTRVAI